MAAPPPRAVAVHLGPGNAHLATRADVLHTPGVSVLATNDASLESSAPTRDGEKNDAHHRAPPRRQQTVRGVLLAKDHFEVLGFDFFGGGDDVKTDAEVFTAYVRAGMATHPASCHDAVNAPAAFVRVGKAFAALRTEKDRRAYVNALATGRRRELPSSDVDDPFPPGTPSSDAASSASLSSSMVEEELLALELETELARWDAEFGNPRMDARRFGRWASVREEGELATRSLWRSDFEDRKEPVFKPRRRNRAIWEARPGTTRDDFLNAVFNAETEARDEYKRRWCPELYHKGRHLADVTAMAVAKAPPVSTKTNPF